ncbi:MAG: hypothetical protein A2V86_14395 [Deltaproteobacteria bacterium RBG_16_49_23]|nr:MAG: hypothetical protein A2V86_14395 [Deltaproteobacteria bacterium RBG_16_49_23]
MVRLLFFVFLLLLLYYILHLLIRDMPSFKKRVKGKHEPEELVQDPYCLTYIPKRSALKEKVEGQVLYFCDEKCRKSYVRREAKNG